MNRQESEIYDVFHPMGFNKTREEEEKQQPNSNQAKRSSSSSPSSPPSTTKKKQNIHRRLEKLSCIMWTCVSLSIAAWMTRQEEDGRLRDLLSLLYSIRYIVQDCIIIIINTLLCNGWNNSVKTKLRVTLNQLKCLGCVYKLIECITACIVDSSST